MAALLTSVLDRSNKVASYIAECKRMGLQLAPPDVNTSMKGFTAEGKVIHYGLLGIKIWAESLSTILSPSGKTAPSRAFLILPQAMRQAF